MRSQRMQAVEVTGLNDEDAMEEQVNRGGQASTSAPAKAATVRRTAAAGKEERGERGQRTPHEEAAAMARAKFERLGQESQDNYHGQWRTFVGYLKLYKIKGENWTGRGAAGSGDDLDISTSCRFWEELRDDHKEAMDRGMSLKAENEKNKNAVYRYRILVSTGGAPGQNGDCIKVQMHAMHAQYAQQLQPCMLQLPSICRRSPGWIPCMLRCPANTFYATPRRRRRS